MAGRATGVSTQHPAFLTFRRRWHLAPPILLLGLLGLVGGCAPVVVGAAATGATVVAQERPVGKAIDDFGIRTSLNNLFFRDNLDLYERVTFTVVEGRVLLKGSVVSPESRRRATELAWQADGVREVINEIQVTNQGGVVDYARDTWISSQLKTKMMFATDVLSINYNIETVNGVIYLMGIAQSQRELDRVIAMARDVPNVVEVVSHVVLKNDPSRARAS